MLCQFFLPSLNVGCVLLISEIKKKKLKTGYHFCVDDYPWLKSGKGLVILNCSLDYDDLLTVC